MTRKRKLESEAATFSATIYFSYSQFQVFDRSVKLPGCAWTEMHYKQGFARRASNVSFGTMLEFGHGDVAVYFGSYEGKDLHERVIEVPIEVSSGEVIISGPEEYPNEHVVKMPQGHYRLVAAQMVTGADREAIDLYFEKLAQPLAKSRIVAADDALSPPTALLETADVA
jgi:hypothetical protein